MLQSDKDRAFDPVLCKFEDMRFFCQLHNTPGGVFFAWARVLGGPGDAEEFRCRVSFHGNGFQSIAPSRMHTVDATFDGISREAPHVVKSQVGFYLQKPIVGEPQVLNVHFSFACV